MTLQDFSDALASIQQRLADAESYLQIDDLRARQPDLEAAASKPDLWDEPDAARRVTSELAAVSDDLALFDGLVARVEDAVTLHELAQEEADESVAAEISEAITGLSAELDDIELRSLFSGEYDEHDALCLIKSGEGGTDAQDWAEMLLRMYRRWAERTGLDVELDAVHEGQEAGLTTAEFIVKGRHAYGLLGWPRDLRSWPRSRRALARARARA